uniref:protein SSUH2 homolog n=1 Tax=Pristiophorus japonicus TaxID=55135 RepID=UPI00398EFCAC
MAIARHMCGVLGCNIAARTPRSEVEKTAFLNTSPLIVALRVPNSHRGTRPAKLSLALPAATSRAAIEFLLRGENRSLRMVMMSSRHSSLGRYRLFRWSENSRLQNNHRDGRFDDSYNWIYIPAPNRARKHDNYESENPVVSMAPEILSEKQVRKALLLWVKQKVQYKQEAAHKMEITEIIPSVIFYYVLDTFIEQRAMHYSYQKSPTIGTALPPNKNLNTWQVHCLPTMFFQDETKYFYMPNSEKKGLCITCYGRGVVLCGRCWGSGEIDCQKGQSSNKRGMMYLCPECTGNSKGECVKCSAIGHIQCQRCSGQGKVWHFTNLKVQYLTQRRHKLIADKEFPTSAAQQAHGQVVHDHASELLQPISTCSVEEVNLASQVLVEESHFASPDARILQQRHSLKAIPVNEVRFAWKGSRGRFWVYGTTRKIYFKNYPQKSIYGAFFRKKLMD